MPSRDEKPQSLLQVIASKLQRSKPEPAPNPLPFPEYTSMTRDLAEALTPVIARLDLLERQNRLLMRQLLLPDRALWHTMPGLLPDMAPGDFIFPDGRLCKEHSFRQPYFSYWAAQLGEPLRYHRKLWEFVFVCQVLYERGMLAPERRGLGFGVGAEPLSAYFAAQGCTVVGTDMASDDAVTAGWAASAQHAAGKQALGRPNLCPPELFDARVRFETVDMNAVPEHLVDFDFCWSACALEHLGSIDLGMAFIERSIETLRPGGIAVHTTEYNVSSNDDTLSEGGTVLFRRQDFEALAARLASKGHRIAPIDFNPGYGKVDRYVDVAPYLDEPHLKLALAGYATTSIGIIVQRGD
ncbi:class I SAM-dependent methyltransferase [Brevundimonas sp. TWP2-3-4b1]|uniref:class I SAM-dependent methyltransferase n=1 Tax=Brevundimonas sp. TWP2-3-4b1 TaxID=2804580 RepID=UPI003CEBD302